MPVIPLAVWGGHRILIKNRKIALRERFGVPIVIVVGEPIMVGPTDDAVAATAQLKATIKTLLETAQEAYPVEGTGPWWQPRHLDGTAPTPEEAAAADAERDLLREQAARERP